MGAKNYRDLVAWQKEMEMARSIYKITEQFPSQENFGLTTQLRRAAVSVSSNIAEGEGRGSRQDFIRFLYIAHGSLREAETQILLAGSLEYVNSETVEQVMSLAGEVGRLIQGLIKSLRRRMD